MDSGLAFPYNDERDLWFIHLELLVAPGYRQSPLVDVVKQRNCCRLTDPPLMSSIDFFLSHTGIFTFGKAVSPRRKTILFGGGLVALTKLVDGSLVMVEQWVHYR
jgi:hypothetical protein